MHTRYVLCHFSRIGYLLSFRLNPILGTVGTTIRVPCGIKVGSTPVKYIDLLKQAIPNADQLVRQSVGYCKCLPKVFDLVDLDTVKKAVNSGDTGVATAEILQKYGEAQQVHCDFTTP